MRVLFAFLLAFTACEAQAYKGYPEPEFVRDGIWRSSRPSEKDLKRVFKEGVRIVVDLENNAEAIEEVREIAERLGFEFYSFPINTQKTPKDKTINAVLELLRDADQPLLVHCKHGQDRTGMIIGLMRVSMDGWTPKRAYEEMLEKGFHPQIKPLDNYYRKRTGLKD